MDKNNKRKPNDNDKQKLESHFLYLKHHMKYMSDNQRKNATRGMSNKLKQAIGYIDEEDQIRK